MGLEFKLEAFEGPLDLLLHLIDRDKINIYDIPIAQITEQYMAYVNQMERQDLELVSEFLVMAATLLDIKARMLLPREETEEEDEGDPRLELVRRLLEYRKYRELSADLKDMSIGSEQHFYKGTVLPGELADYREPVDLDELLTDVTAERLKKIFDDILRRVSERVDETRSDFGRIQREEIPISARIDYVRESVKNSGRLSFRQLLLSGTEKRTVIVTFLAVLELLRSGELRLTEDSTTEDFTVEGTGYERAAGED